MNTLNTLSRKNLSVNNKAWVVAVNMGYGHQRTAYPLSDLAGAGIINANDYPGIPEKDRIIWENTRRGYEFISNFKKTPVIGDLAFSVFDIFQRISSFYPKRDLSRPNLSLRQNYLLIKRGWGRHLIGKLKVNLPLISTFFTPAFMAEVFNYPGQIFCVVCDADIARHWAPLNPKESRLKYFAPTERVVERLKLYGVKPENIFFTGYPLPVENIGGEKFEVLKNDLRHRLLNLDPRKRYLERYRILIENHLGKLPERPERPLTIMFSIGGAGAQKEIAISAMKGLGMKIREGEIKILLSVGIRENIREYFLKNIKKLELAAFLNKNIELITAGDIREYFREFNLALRKTDILWTKPSELSFYAALGLPIIIAPPVGSHEDFNFRWLLKSGFGIPEENPKFTEDWLFDWLEKGYLAECAMSGFIKGEKMGTYRIREIISKTKN